MPRLAWFSPMPPAPTGVARCSADLIERLERDHTIDVFVDEPLVAVARHARSAHDFVWLHHRQPYDLIVYQLGNSSHHDYIWPYLFRYPGLTVLHDAHLHHARAASLLRNFRPRDYRAEFAANHPQANADLAELAVAGFDNHLHYFWPMTALVIRASRLTLVHRPEIAASITHELPDARVEAIRLGHGAAISAADENALSQRARARFGIDEHAVVFGCYGGLTPAKRVPQVLAAFAATRAYVPAAHLLLAGAEQPHYDVRADVTRLGLSDCTTLTGYLDDEEAFLGCVAACDVALNLRWPTAKEVSGPWLHCLALGKPSIIVDLAHLSSVPTVDPRTWMANTNGLALDGNPAEPCSVAIDILDEDHSLRLAMRRLATDAAMRQRLSAAARDYWAAHHSVDLMANDYRRAISRTLGQPVPAASLPGHLMDIGARTLERELERFNLPEPLTLRAGPDGDA